MPGALVVALGVSPVASAAPLSAPIAAPAEVRQALAPTGALRVGVYPGSPTSMVRDAKTGERRGISVDLGAELADRLGVPVRLVVFDRVAQVVDALKAGSVDFTVTNATANASGSALAVARTWKVPLSIGAV